MKRRGNFNKMGISHRALDSVATKEKSAIKQNSIHYKTNVNFSDFKVLFFVSFKQFLLIAESLFIKQLAPNLNSDLSSVPLYIT